MSPSCLQIMAVFRHSDLCGWSHSTNSNKPLPPPGQPCLPHRKQLPPPRVEVKTEPIHDTSEIIISSSSPMREFREQDCDFASLRPIYLASLGGGSEDRFSSTVPLLHPHQGGESGGRGRQTFCVRRCYLTTTTCLTYSGTKCHHFAF